MKLTSTKADHPLAKSALKQAKNNLTNRYSDYWKQTITNQPKMRTYIKFKSNFVIEDYLNIHNVHARKALSRLRTSARNLRIERDRYATPRIPPDKRICIKCNMGHIEDELHFLLECPLYSNERQAFINSIMQSVPNFRKSE